MKYIKINNLQHERDHWRHEAHKNPADENWKTYREKRNEMKNVNKENSVLQKKIYLPKIMQKSGKSYTVFLT